MARRSGGGGEAGRGARGDRFHENDGLCLGIGFRCRGAGWNRGKNLEFRFRWQPNVGIPGIKNEFRDSEPNSWIPNKLLVENGNCSMFNSVGLHHLVENKIMQARKVDSCYFEDDESACKVPKDK